MIEWRPPSVDYGPNAEGWCMTVGMTDYGAAHTYANIAFCPWCGQRLPDAKKE